MLARTPYSKKRNKTYFGKVCQNHPTWKGERWLANTGCVECSRERRFRHPIYTANRRRPENLEKSRNYYMSKERKEARNFYLRTVRRKTLYHRLYRSQLHRIRLALSGHKSVSTQKLLGCTVEHLIAHIEKQFLTGMNWKNRSQWHIDHIRPCASFDLTKPTQQRKCFHYTNLRPLWALDNIRKGAKIAD